jgi:DNA-directed RNA polymerase sigma subunit (sigma70/sigma32)
MNARRAQFQRLRKEGKTYQEIGDIMRVSRQRVHQVLTGYKSPAYRKLKENQAA